VINKETALLRLANMSTNQAVITPETAQTPLFAGVDVGGTNIKIGLVDDKGRTLAFQSIETMEELGPADAVRRIKATLHEMLFHVSLTMDDVKAIGLGTPGTMDIPRGMILAPPNLPHWRDFPVRDQLSEVTSRPVAFVNDANAAAFGEFWVGSGRDFRTMIMLTLGTGVGGGIILDGRSIEGEHSFGSECGHIIIDHNEDARCCVWGGGRGQLEAYCSASAVVRRTEEALEAGRKSALTKRINAGEELTSLMIAEKAASGDQLSLDIVLETAMYLGVGIVTLVHTVDPGAVILGGAMDFGGQNSELGQKFLARVREEFQRRAFDVVADHTVIDFAQLGSDAGYIGAAGVARESA